jgi:hypothetical protein
LKPSKGKWYSAPAEFSGVRLREIGSLFDVRETAIAEASRRFSFKMGEDKKLREMAERVKRELEI